MWSFTYCLAPEKKDEEMRHLLNGLCEEGHQIYKALDRILKDPMIGDMSITFGGLRREILNIKDFLRKSVKETKNALSTIYEDFTRQLKDIERQMVLFRKQYKKLMKFLAERKEKDKTSKHKEKPEKKKKKKICLDNEELKNKELKNEEFKNEEGKQEKNNLSESPIEKQPEDRKRPEGSKNETLGSGDPESGNSEAKKPETTPEDKNQEDDTLEELSL